MLHYTWMNRPVAVLTQHPALVLGCHKKKTILVFFMVCRPEFPCDIQHLFCYLPMPTRGAGYTKRPHISAFQCYYPARDFLKAQSLLDPGCKMKCDGEVSLKSKSTPSTASV